MHSAAPIEMHKQTRNLMRVRVSLPAIAEGSYFLYCSGTVRYGTVRHGTVRYDTVR